MFNIWQNAVRVNQCTAVAATFRFHKFNPWLGCDLFSVDLWWELCSEREVGREDNITALYPYGLPEGQRGDGWKVDCCQLGICSISSLHPPTPPHPHHKTIHTILSHLSFQTEVKVNSKLYLTFTFHKKGLERISDSISAQTLKPA